MGAWGFVAPITLLIGNRWRRCQAVPSSSPAEGSSTWHAANQATLLQQAHDPGPDKIPDDFIIS
jgi:hypothetical protein